MSDRSADSFDIASEYEDKFREEAIQAVRAKALEKHPDFDGCNCVDCGLDIPAERLKLGAYRCVPCQTDRERRSKLYYTGR